MDKPADSVEPRTVLRLIAGCAVFGSLLVAVYALQAADGGQFASILGVGLLVAGSSLLCGALLGFLFGIPRALQQGAPEGPSAEGQAPAASPARGGYRANTSLEQISDWLTKILVGVGLTQLSSLPGALKAYAEFAAAGLGGFATSPVFSVALLIYYLVCGFLVSYLWTRLNLGRAFTEAEAAYAEIRGALKSVESKVSELQEKAERQFTSDYTSLEVIQRQLESGGVPQAEIDAALRETSDLFRSHIYQLAARTRAENWRDPKKKPKMERAIPVFRGLVATDDKGFHQSYGQLGFALAESDPPDYRGAREALDKAVDLRGPGKTQGYLLYEFVRAMCRIQDDPDFLQHKPSDPKVKKAVLDDLRTAAQWSELAELMATDDRVRPWLDLNHVKLKSLTAPAP